MRIIHNNRSVEITELATKHLLQLCRERAENIEEIRSLTVVFRERVAAREEHSQLFRENLSSIIQSIEDLEADCVRWQKEIEAMQAELKRRVLGIFLC